jgi:hypothetical protein
MSYIKVTADRLSELREAEEKLKTVEAERDDNKRKFKKADSLALEFENKLRTVEAERESVRSHTIACKQYGPLKQFQAGVEFCINELRKLQDSSKFYSKHQKQWNFSASTDFAPVELSDYLVKRFKKHLKELEGGE